MDDVDLAALFDEIITKTEQREAFSAVKEANIGFSAIEDMKALRSELVSSETELDLWFALVKLSNARRDRHLHLIPVSGGLRPPERRPCVSAPIRVLPEHRDGDNPVFFVASVGEGIDSPQVGDVLLGVNGLPINEHIGAASQFLRHSTLPALHYGIARDLPRRIPSFPLDFYRESLHLTLERPLGQTYEVVLDYSEDCPSFFSPIMRSPDPYSGFVEVMDRQNFQLRLDRAREIILLRWWEFDPEYLIQDMNDLTEYGEREEILDWNMVIDVTYSGGGHGAHTSYNDLWTNRFARHL